PRRPRRPPRQVRRRGHRRPRRPRRAPRTPPRYLRNPPRNRPPLRRPRPLPRRRPRPRTRALQRRLRGLRSPPLVILRSASDEGSSPDPASGIAEARSFAEFTLSEANGLRMTPPFIMRRLNPTPHSMSQHELSFTVLSEDEARAR